MINKYGVKLRLDHTDLTPVKSLFLHMCSIYKVSMTNHVLSTDNDSNGRLTIQDVMGSLVVCWQCAKVRNCQMIIARLLKYSEMRPNWSLYLNCHNFHALLCTVSTVSRESQETKRQSETTRKHSQDYLLFNCTRFCETKDGVNENHFFGK